MVPRLLKRFLHWAYCSLVVVISANKSAISLAALWFNCNRVLHLNLVTELNLFIVFLTIYLHEMCWALGHFLWLIVLHVIQHICKNRKTVRTPLPLHRISCSHEWCLIVRHTFNLPVCGHSWFMRASSVSAVLYVNTLILSCWASGQLSLPLNSHNPWPLRFPLHRKLLYSCVITQDFFLLRSTVCLKGSPSVAKGTINFGSLLWGIWKLKLSLLDYSC